MRQASLLEETPRQSRELLIARPRPSTRIFHADFMGGAGLLMLSQARLF